MCKNKSTRKHTESVFVNTPKALCCLFGAAVVLSFAGCQKETDDSWTSLAIVSQERQAAFHVCYHVDDAAYHVTVSDETALRELMHQLDDLAAQGHHIRIYDEDKVSAVASKETLTFETTSKDEIVDWSTKMFLNGYDVDYSFDEKSGKYIGVARK